MRIACTQSLDAVWPLTNIDIRGTFRVRTTYRLSRVNWVNWIAPCRGHVENAPGIQSTNCRLRAIHSSCAEEILLVQDFWLVFFVKIFFFVNFFLQLIEILWIIMEWKLWKWRNKWIFVKYLNEILLFNLFRDTDAFMCV